MYTKNKFTNSNNHNLRDDFENIKEKASDTRDAVITTAKHAKQNASDIVSLYRDKLSKNKDDIEESIKSNPGKSIGLAIFMGILAIFLLRK